MAQTITLVLLGGGVMLGGAAMLMGPGSGRENRQRECQEARAQNRPDAEQICAAARTSSSAGSPYHGGSWFVGRSGRSSGSTGGAALVASNGFRGGATSVSSRGGFGSSAHSSSGS
ncbi:hypothetical protein AAFN86_20950 [Roseomonas sp. CAU 1739]|uniref:hypothetical protein n=1 Tax=Roseomonas sp. CAU 1739 TaxID=3140364 RepID=UPI00325B4825